MIQSFLDMNQVIVNNKNNNQYSLLEKVGEGQYAEVYKGLNTATNQLVAIKKMKTLKAADSQMAKKEIKLMKTFDHKNIVKWIDDFRMNGIWYIVLQYCGKGDLQKLKEKIGKVPQHHCRALVRGILEALNEIHTKKKVKVEINGQKKQIERKIAHRDLKLANILVNDKMQLKLADFGFSKDFEEGWLKSFCGTPLTMAPEVLKREKYNEKCDIWSLGVITYFLLYDKYPFLPNREDGPGFIGLTKAVTNRKPVFDMGVPVSKDGIYFMEKCLQKSIEKRPLSHELLKDPWMQQTYTNATLDSHTKQYLRKGIQLRPEDEALKKLKLMLFGVSMQHINKIYDGLLLSRESVETTIAGLHSHYSNNNPKILSHYLQVIYSKLNELRNREIILSYEQEISNNISKKQISIKLAEIKRYHQFEEAVRKIIDPLQPAKLSKSLQESNSAQELVMFLIEETEKLMDCFNQKEVDSKVELFKTIAKLITVDYDETLICVRWGERDELAQLGFYVFEAVNQLDGPKMLALINEEQADDEDLESTWMIEHHITESPNRNTTEYELGRLVLSILKISSNFNIDTTMETEKLDFKSFGFEDDCNFIGELGNS